MKFPSLFILLITVLSVSSCEVDATNGPRCTQADFVDVFAGPEDCGGDPEDVTYTITAEGSSAIKIRIRFADGLTLTTVDAVRLNGCSFTFGDDELTVDGTLDGDVLTVVATRDSGSCTATLSRS